MAQELSSSAVPPAPIDIEELNKVGKHAEVRSWFPGQCCWCCLAVIECLCTLYLP